MAELVKDEPIWLATARSPGYPSLAADLTVDVLVIGAGAAGLMAAYTLQKAGLAVAVLEQGRVGHGATGHGLGFLTQVYDTPLSRIAHDFGAHAAGMLWEAGRGAIDAVERLVVEEGLDCDFERVPAYHFAAAWQDVDRLEDETDLALALGFPAQMALGKPFPPLSFGAMRTPGQAQLHPGRYVQGLAESFCARGGQLFESTRVTETRSGESARVTANGHTVTADHVFFATHLPLDDAALIQRIRVHQTYALALTAADDAFPHALAWDTRVPYRAWRAHAEAGREVLVVSGEARPAGLGGDPEDGFARLEAYVKDVMGNRPYALAHRWSGLFAEPLDGLPLIGRRAGTANEYVGTGYGRNGLAMATYAGLLVADLVLGAEPPAARLFSPTRSAEPGPIMFLLEGDPVVEVKAPGELRQRPGGA